MSPRSTGRTRASGSRTNGKSRHDDDAAEVLAEYDPKYLECRGINHPWRQVGFYRNGGFVVRVLRCPRCTMTREDTWSERGDRMTQRYIPPDGYSISGHGHVNPIDIRVEVIHRANIFPSEEALEAAMRSGRKRA